MRGMNSPLPVRVLPIFFFGFLILSPAGHSQNPSGALRGIVTDSSGARVANASVVVSASEFSGRRELAADERGEFRADNLAPGNYTVDVTAQEFEFARAEVAVVVGSVRDLQVVLKPQSVRQVVEVPGQASSITTQPLDLATAVEQGAVTQQDLQTLPLAARSFANIAYLVPGTEPVEPSDPTKARITAVSFGGSSGLNVELSVDGGDNSDDYIGGFLQNYSPDAVQEFVVRTALEDADTGRTTAGSVVITTRRGIDQWHGSASIFERAASLNARFPIDNPAPNPKQPFSRQNYVGTVGGPIKKELLWTFTSFEFVDEDASIAYSPANLSEFDALAQLASMGLIPGVNSIPVPDNVGVPFRDYLITQRFDWAQSSRSQWTLRAAADRYTTKNDLVQQGTLPGTGATSRSNYMNLLLSQRYSFSSSWLGSFVFEASGLHHTETRNSDLGFALAFPFSSTALTTSGFETFGDNQFVTPITAFPVLRNQQKYQFRYDVTHSSARHTPRFGVNFIHEPVLSGSLANPETIIQYPADPSVYTAAPAEYYFSASCTPPPPAGSGIVCTPGSGGFGPFSQNVQRLGLYAQDSWRLRPRLTFNYGLRYDTTFGLFLASNRDQFDNAAFLTLQALQIPLVMAAPHDYRSGLGPRLGIAYALGSSQTTVLRAGFGLFFNDLAQNGWVTAFQAVASPPAPCVITPLVESPGCIPGAAEGGAGTLIDPNYKTPYALHATAGVQHAFSTNWMLSADYIHETGMHGYRRYDYFADFTLFAPDPALQPFAPDISVFRSDNRSAYNGLSIHLQGNVSRRLHLIANYTLSKATTWGCVLGELFDYVNGVCNPLDAFAKGDYGPSGEDVRHRFVLAGTFHAPAGFEISTLTQLESARPFTLTTPVDVNGLGDAVNDRAVVNGVQTSLDELRGAPYIQADLRVSRPFHFHERWSATPFVEFFNLFNRNNPGANYVTNVAALPVPQTQLNNVTDLCLNPSCTQLQPITSLKQLRMPGGALGDFFGPGTTVGIPFAAQLGFRLNF
jgi:carboxypeptidase family protein/TonB-dependent receptor-like protein